MSLNGSNSNGNGNGNKSLIPWVTGVVLAPVFMTVFANLFSTTFMNRERTAALEADYRQIKSQLDRIDTKLERLLERDQE